MENVTPTPDAQDVADNKVMAILGYILFFIPLLAAKESPFARFHANQGLLVLLLAIGLGIVFFILTLVGTMIAPAIGGIIYIVSLVCNLGVFVLVILGIINAAQGQMKELPVIGKFRLIK